MVHRLLLEPEPSPPASADGTEPGSRSYMKEANFDTNMVIILAALLCALICALGLNSIVRFLLRCGRRFPFQTPNEISTGPAPTSGLKRSALRKIPMSAYRSGTDTVATDCPICLGEFKEGERLKVLPKCHHGFHVKCIDMWLVSHSSCPTCRQSLLEQTSISSDVGGANDQNSHGEQGGVPISIDEMS